MNYIISEKDLIELLTSAYKYYALENGGVDNWVWYSTAMGDWEAENGDFEEAVKADLRAFRKADED